MMQVSLNEVFATARKAALGNLLPIGVADDVAAAMRFASAGGLPVIEPLAALLSDCATLCRHMPECATNGDTLVWKPTNSAHTICPLMFGPSFADSLQSHDASVSRIVLKNVQAPVLLAGFFCDFEGDAHITWGDSFVSISDGRVQEFSVTGTLTGVADVTVSLDADDVQYAADNKTANSIESGVAVEDAVWSALTAEAAKTLVPETEESRLHGAGAGLVDTD